MSRAASFFLLLLAGCQQPDFYKDGKPYRVIRTCLDKHKERTTHDTYSFRFGWSASQSWKWVCDRERVDTIEVQAFGR